MTLRLTDNPPELLLPKGVKDLLPAKAAKLEYLDATLRAVYARWGCRPLILPGLEFYDMLEKGMGDGLSGKTFRFDDRQSGQLLAIPPDITPQVARVVATRMRDLPLPLKFCYRGRVLRHAEQQLGKDREIYQSGVELFGLETPEADAEMIAMAIEGLQAVGAKDFTVDIGHAEFLRGALEPLADQPALTREVATAIVQKDSTSLQRLLEGAALTDAVRGEILALPKLFGGRDVIARARTLVANPRSLRALETLERVLAILDVFEVGDHVSIDLGEVRTLNYHTGVIYQGFMAGMGQAVLQGGRYDNLTAAYGQPMPATGFTFNLLDLLAALDRTLDARIDGAVDVLIFAEGADKRPAQRAARTLRQRGYSAARDMIVRGLPATLEYARRMNYRYVLVIAASGVDARLIGSADGSERNLTLDALGAPEFSLPSPERG